MEENNMNVNVDIKVDENTKDAITNVAITIGVLYVVDKIADLTKTLVCGDNYNETDENIFEAPGGFKIIKKKTRVKNTTLGRKEFVIMKEFQIEDGSGRTEWVRVQADEEEYKNYMKGDFKRYKEYKKDTNRGTA